MVIKKTDTHPKVAYGKNSVLLINLGTPSSTSKKAIKKYLKEFLSDNRIIEVNKYLWWFILNIIILNVRPAKTAKTYKEIWMHDLNQSPLRYYTIQQKKQLSKKLSKKTNFLELGEPSGSSMPTTLSKLSGLSVILSKSLSLYVIFIFVLSLYPSTSVSIPIMSNV